VPVPLPTVLVWGPVDQVEVGAEVSKQESIAWVEVQTALVEFVGLALAVWVEEQAALTLKCLPAKFLEVEEKVVQAEAHEEKHSTLMLGQVDDSEAVLPPWIWVTELLFVIAESVVLVFQAAAAKPKSVVTLGCWQRCAGTVLLLVDHWRHDSLVRSGLT